MKEKKTRVRVLMKRKTLLKLILMFGILLFLLIITLQSEYNKANNTTIPPDNLTNLDTINTVDVIDIMKNEKAEVVCNTKEHYKIMKDGKYGVIDCDGNLIIEPKYNELQILDNELLFINKNEVIDLSENHIADGAIEMFDILGYSYFISDRFVSHNNKLKGVVNTKGEHIIPAKYTDFIIPNIQKGSSSQEETYMNSTIEDVILAKEGTSYTLYDYSGNIIVTNVSHFLNNEYMNIELNKIVKDERISNSFDCFMASIVSNSKKMLYFFRTKKLVSLENCNSIKYKEFYNHRDWYTEEYIECFDADNKLIKAYDQYGNEILTSKYEHAIDLVEKNGKYALLNSKNNKLITEYEYDFSDINVDYDRGVALTVKNKNHITLFNINNNGEKIIEYDTNSYRNSLEPFANQIYANTKYKIIPNENGLYGIISKTGKEIVPFEYNKIIHFDCFDNIFILRKNNNDILINIETNSKTEKYKFEKVLESSNLYHPNCFGWDYRRYYNSNSLVHELISKTHNILNKENGYIVAKDKETNKHCILNKEFEEVIKPIYDDIELWYNTIKICTDSKYGLLDEKYNEIIKPIYDSMELDNKLAILKLNNKYGLLSMTGKQLLSCIYDTIEIKKYNYYSDEYYIEAKLNDTIKLFHVDSDMNIKEFNFGKNVKIIRILDSSDFIVKKDEKMAFICNQAYVTDFIYDDIYIYHSSIGVMTDDQFGILDRNGTVILEPSNEHVYALQAEYCIGKWFFFSMDSFMLPGISTKKDLELLRNY